MRDAQNDDESTVLEIGDARLDQDPGKLVAVQSWPVRPDGTCQFFFATPPH